VLAEERGPFVALQVAGPAKIGGGLRLEPIDRDRDEVGLEDEADGDEIGATLRVECREDPVIRGGREAPAGCRIEVRVTLPGVSRP
jgi:hypothetical protein